MDLKTKFSLNDYVFSKKALKNKRFIKFKIISIEVKHYAIEESIYTEIFYILENEKDFKYTEKDLISESGIKEFIKTEKENDINDIKRMYKEIEAGLIQSE